MNSDKVRASRQSQPNSDLKSLEKLLGTWKVSGDARGQIRYERMEGGFFLAQHVDLEYSGKRIKGIEVMGHLNRIGEEPSKEIWTRFYSYLDGLTLDYVYELADDNITIWFGKKGSDNFFRGKFSSDAESFAGAWQWPGGGYKITAARMKA